MAERIRWSLEVDPPNSDSVLLARSVPVDATDRVEVTIEDGDSVEVPVQPGASDDVALLLITASTYGDALTYRVGSSTVDIELDAPQLFTGAGMIGRLPTDPKSLTFENNLGAAVTVEIVAGRTVPV